MVEIESARGVNSIILKFRLTLEHRRECSGVEQPWFQPDGCSLSFQRGSRLRCQCLKARNHQDSSSPGFHIRHKTKVPLVCPITDPYPLSWDPAWSTILPNRKGQLSGVQCQIASE